MAAAFLAGILLPSCIQDNLIDTSFSLYYSEMTEICPGKGISVSPSWHGEKPTDFYLTGVKLDGKKYTGDISCFRLDTLSGSFSVIGSDSLDTGNYKLSLKCKSAGKPYSFDDIISIEMMNPIPPDITAQPNRLSVMIGDVRSSSDTVRLPSSVISADGTNNLKIVKYLIANVYRNGEPAPECLSWFKISSDGLFTIVSSNPEIMAGRYVFDFRLTTLAVGEDSEEGIFRNALTLDINSAPENLVYEPTSGKLERGYSGKSPVPVLSGSNTGLKYELLSVKPDNNIGITVNSATGVIVCPEGYYGCNVGDTYTVSVKVSNEFGSCEFADAYSFNVISYLEPITQLAYPSAGSKIEGEPFSLTPSVVDGEDVEYQFVDLPAVLSGLSISKTTGEISCPKGFEMPLGTNTITVRAANFKSEKTASVSVNVTKNPYKFTYVRWGNNLGLTPIEDYADQFRVEYKQAAFEIPIAATDIPSGQPVKFTIEPHYQASKVPMGVSINSATGTITLKGQEIEEDGNAVKVHSAYVTVTVGGDSPVAVTKRFFFFVDQQGYRKGYRFEYTPFVMKVNPKRGGTSVAPKVTAKGSSTQAEGITMDYRRAYGYWNLNGPSSHDNSNPKAYGQMSASNTNLLTTLWYRYCDAVNYVQTINTSGPVGYWNGIKGANYKLGRLNLAILYVEPEQLRVVVNPEKWVDENGYADGCFIGNIEYNINGLDPSTNTNSAMSCTPIAILFDPNYEK